ncbi:hypothetical protein [Helicobacter rodentium]|nr:hypothetical protein [Helicobacter rodentium]
MTKQSIIEHKEKLYNRSFTNEIPHYRLPRKFFKFSRNDAIQRANN